MQIPSARTRASTWRILIAFLSLALIAAAPPPRGDPRLIGELGVADRDHCPAFSPDGTWLLTAGDEEVAGESSYFVTKWDVRTRKVLARFPVESIPGYGSSRLTVSPSGKTFAYCDGKGKVVVRDSSTGKTVFSYRQWEDGTTDGDLLTFLDDDHIFSVDSDGIGQKRNIRNGRTELHRIGVVGTMHGIALSPRKGLLAYITGAELFVVKADLKKDGDSFKHGMNYTRRPLAITDDGAYALAGHRFGGLALFDVKGKKLIRRWQGHQYGEDEALVLQIKAIPGRNVFVTTDTVGTIRFWGTKGERLAEVRRYIGEMHPLAVSPDGKVLATGGEEQPIVLWDLEKILPKKAK